MKKIKNLNISKKAVSIILAGVAFCTSEYSSFKFHKEAPIEISSGFYYGVIDQIDSEYYSLKQEENTNMFKTNQVNLSINKQELKKISELVIDASDSDFANILLFENLNKLTIINADKLSEYDIRMINISKQIKDILLCYSFDDYSFDLNSSLSFPKFRNKNVEIFSISNYGDLKDLYIYKMYENMDEEEKSNIKFNVFDEKRIKDFKRWDSRINEIIKSFKFEKNTTEIDKILKVLCYITDMLEYDPEVSENDNEYKVEYYNSNLLKDFFDSETKYGICCNYTALMSVFCKYLNIDMESVSGIIKDSIVEHSWCEYDYDKDGTKEIFDLTALDSMFSFNVLKNSYELGNITDDMKDKLIEISIFDTVDDIYNLYIKNDNASKVIDDKEEKINYSNTLAQEYCDTILSKRERIFDLIVIVLLLIVLKNMLSIIDEDYEKEKKYIK